MKKRFYGLLLLLLFASPAVAQAASPTVNAALPDFPVRLNGTLVDNTCRQYPLLVYNQITYFPMTYHDCRYLGVETAWSNEAGLSIEQTGVSAAYRSYTASKRNGSHYQAQPADFSVTVCGQSIDNGAEPYPLLVFRDVTYFPLTWRFAHDTFGWDYQYTEQNGLSITSRNPVPEPLNFQNIPAANEPALSLALDGQSCYYRGKDGRVWQHDLATAAETAVFEFPPSTPLGSVQKTARGIELAYHTGGATMGIDYRYRLNADGSTTQLNHQYHSADLETDDGILVSIQQGPALSNNTIEVRFPGEDWRSLTLSAGQYGLYTYDTGGYRSSDCSVLEGHQLYLLASLDDARNRVCRINLDTSELTVLSDQPARQFVIAGGLIYFVSGNDVCQLPLNGGTSAKVLSGLPADGEEQAMTQIAAVGDTLYAALADVRNSDGTALRHLYRLDSPQPIYGESSVLALASQGGYLICQFPDTADTAYRSLVLNEEGHIVYKTSDAFISASIDQNRLAYSLSPDSQGYLVYLP